MENTPLVKSVIRLYIPIYTKDITAFRSSLVKDKRFQIENELNTCFYLKYIERIFNTDGIFSDCFVVKTNTPSYKISVCDTEVSMIGARIFSFDTSVAFLELSFSYEGDSMDNLSDISSALRLSNRENICLSDGKKISINKISSDILKNFSNYTMFSHLSSSSETRPELFVTLVLDKDIENKESYAFKIASGLDNKYMGETNGAKTYSNYPYINWTVTERGVCNLGVKTDDVSNRDFVEKSFISYTDTRYIIWYILVLHQKYALYHFINDIASKKSSNNLKSFEKTIMNFNTKYRFTIISEEISHQRLYELMSEVKMLEIEFNDIDEKVARVAEHNDAINDKNTSRAMAIVSALCAISAIKDFYEILSSNATGENFITAFENFSSLSKILSSIFIILIVIALAIVFPKRQIVRFFVILKRKFIKTLIKLGLK